MFDDSSADDFPTAIAVQRPFRTPATTVRLRIPAVLLAVSALMLTALGPAWAKKPKDPVELFTPMLGIEYAHWLVGPIVEMASEKEVETYLFLTSDEKAAEFVEKFWEKHNEGTPVFQKTPRQTFEERAEEADKKYSEGTYPGRRTDRGTVLILYGEPETIEFESPQRVGDPPLEVWKYPKGAEKGLDGKKPKRQFRFVRIRDSVVRYTGQSMRQDPRDRLKRGRYRG